MLLPLNHPYPDFGGRVPPLKINIMKHLEEFKVEFQGTMARRFNDELYYRSFFTIDGKEYSIKNPEPLGGLTGTVMFVKKDELTPDGKKVAQDSFTLRKVVTIDEIVRGIQRKKAQRESAALD